MRSAKCDLRNEQQRETREERREKKEEINQKRGEIREEKEEMRVKREEVSREAARGPQRRPQKVPKEVPRALLASWRPDRVRGRDGEERVRPPKNTHELRRVCFPKV